MFKDPLVLEFLKIPAAAKLVESDLESALLSQLQAFLLELGKGFAFVARQQRITLDGDHFYIDLVFYHTVLKCYVLLDLKVGKLTHQDLGQLQLYVNYYDREPGWGVSSINYNLSDMLSRAEPPFVTRSVSEGSVPVPASLANASGYKYESEG